MRKTMRIAGIFLAIMMLFTLTSCTPKTAEKGKEKMEKKGYNVVTTSTDVNIGDLFSTKTEAVLVCSKEVDGKKIAVQLGNVADSYAKKNYKNSEIIRQKKYLSMVEDLKAGKVDLIIMDNLPAQEIVKANDSLKILPGYLFSDSYGIAVKKGNTELINNINTVLNRLMSEGKIEEYIINHSK